ncbi:hypothetical protein HDU96_008779, partial [Phlyctochytrium bullatum]
NLNKRTLSTIPSTIVGLDALEYLGIAESGLSGSIPSAIGSLSSLTNLIPKELGNLRNLTWLDLDSNVLSGSIPEELGNLRNLTGLILYNNTLSGNVPRAIAELPKLTYLDMHSNYLAGPIPSFTNVSTDFRMNCFSPQDSATQDSATLTMRTDYECSAFYAQSGQSSSAPTSTQSTTTRPIFISITIGPAITKSTTTTTTRLTPTTTTTTTTSPPTTSDPPIAAIAGGATGALVLLAAILVAVFLLKRRRASSSFAHDVDAPPAPAPPAVATRVMAEKSSATMFHHVPPAHHTEPHPPSVAVEPRPPSTVVDPWTRGAAEKAAYRPPTAVAKGREADGMRAEREARSRIEVMAPTEVGEMMMRMGVGAGLVAALEEHEIDGGRLLALTDADLVAMGIQEWYSRDLVLRTAAYVLASEVERGKSSRGGGVSRREGLPTYSK